MFTYYISGCLCESCSVVFDSLRPHGLYSPWNSPGQNTGVGSHSLLQGIFPTQESNLGPLHWEHRVLVTAPPGKSQGILKSMIKFQSVLHTDQAWLRGEHESGSVMSDSLRPHGLYSPWNSPGQNTGVGSLSLLQRIFLTQN